jgi:hypothetical protein
VETDDSVWDRLPDSAAPPLEHLEHQQLMTALHRAVDEYLTDRQRLIFQSVTLDDVPIDVLAERLGRIAARSIKPFTTRAQSSGEP